MMKNSNTKTDPGRDCPLCPRLVEFREKQRIEHPDWHNAPVDTWVAPDGDATVKLLIVGLAPGLRGANCTGRPFTGDWAGDLLYETLGKYGFATGDYEASPNDSLQLTNCAITNSVRCVPPENKPVGAEINSCRPFLVATMNRFANLKAVVTLGKIAHDSTLRALGVRVAEHPFGHHQKHQMPRFSIFSSYHCSRYNTNTGRLTSEMFEAVFEDVRHHCAAS